MPTGVLVSLGNGILEAGDSTANSGSTFTTSSILGAGTWNWEDTGILGLFGSNGVEAGTYHLATNGNVYFVPDDGTLPSSVDIATVGTHPTYPNPDGVVDGTSGDDIMNVGYTDDQTDEITTGNDEIIGGGGNDNINAGAGNDTIIGDQTGANDGLDTIDGGAGDDLIYGDSTGDSSGVAETTIMSWEDQGVADEADLTGGLVGVTANGDVSVTLSVTQEENFTETTMETSDNLYSFDGRDDDSSITVRGGAGADNTNSATIRLDFDALSTGYADEVSNVSFGIFDLDEVAGNFREQVIITAYGPDGTIIPTIVTLGNTNKLDTTTNPDGSVTVEAEVGAGNVGTADQDGYLRVDVAGPVSYIEVDYNNVGPGFSDHSIRIGDVELTTIPDSSVPDDGGADVIDGGSGADTIFGQGGDDEISGGSGVDSIEGGLGDDTIYGDDSVTVAATEFSWEDHAANGSDASGGITANTADGNIQVAMSIAQEDNFGFATISNETLYNYNGLDDDSSIDLDGGSGSATNASPDAAVVTLDFSAAVAGYTGEVSDVTFGIFDIDEVDAQFTDQVIIKAYDAQGNQIPVDLTAGVPADVAANDATGTATAVEDAGSAETNQINGFLQVSVAGPVASITIDYNNVDSAYGNHAIRIGDLELTAIPDAPIAGDADDIDGGVGDDLIFGQGGNDTISGGGDDDTIEGGAGDDVLSGDGGEAATVLPVVPAGNLITNGDFTDDFDGWTVNNITGATPEATGTGNTAAFNTQDESTYGDSVLQTFDANIGQTQTVSLDLIENNGGDGDHTFRIDILDANGAVIATETHTVLNGTTEAVSFTFVPTTTENTIVITNTTSTETINTDGKVDNVSIVGSGPIPVASSDDSISGGDGNDTIEGEIGDDTLSGDDGDDELAGGTGDDSITGGIGNDTILIEDGFGSDVIDASEDAGDGDIDVLDASGLTEDVLMYLTGPDNEAGFIISGADTTGFENVEHVILGSGDDTIFGSTLDDSVTAGAGADTINMGTGNDTVDLGAGAVDGEDDVVILQDDFGNDVVTNFDAPTANPDGQTFASGDLLNVTNLLDLGSNPVETNDVTVGNDGSNNAVLTFPNGESITLVGITPADADNPFYLNALGIPLSLDGIVDGTAVADTIDGGYTGDPDGDLVDANDAILPGDTGDDDVIYGYAGNDTITAGAGNDEVYGGDDNDNIYGGIGNDTLSGGAGNDYLEDGTGDDVITGGAGDDNIAFELGNDSADGGAGDDLFEVAANQGNDTIIGGETGETEGDTLALDAATGANVVADGDESGNATLGSGTVEFSEIEIIATDDGNDTIDLSASSVGMTVLSGDGNDDITGTTGDDEIVAGVGADTINAGEGNDTIDLGDGTPDGDDDVIVLEDGFGNDTVTNFDAPIDNGGGNYTVTDTLDVSGLYDLPIGDPDRTPVLTTDVVVTDDGAGNAVLTFPNGEVITLGGVSSTDAADPFYLNALGIPMPDGIVSGTTGNDTIDASYNGDPDGDVVDGNDAILTGHAPNDDSIEAGAGDDLIISGAGDDTIIGGIGDDTVVIGDGFGNHDITGSEGSETDGDTIDGSTLTENVTVDFAAIETGTIDNGNDTVAFNSIENVVTGSGNDTVFGGVGSQNVSTGAGDDTIQTTGTGADTIDTGAGDDAITFSEGDSISGGTGNDTFTYENLGEGTITIVGGQGGETPDDGNPLTSEGDTLQLGENADMSTLIITSTTVNGDGNTSYAGTIQLDDGTLLVFSEIENIICFTPGTRVSTPFGARDIATLKVGDLVLTLDHGPQPIRWIQKRTVPAIDRFAPIRIKPGVVAGQERDLLVSPQHRMMFEGYRAQLLFGESQILVAAKHLVDDSLVTQETGGEVTYIHMLFDEHEVVFAEGAPTESFHPGDLSLSAVSDPAREELFSLFPELRSNVGAYGQTARRCLRGHEGQLLTA